jgi:hypothetical protein
MNELPIFCKREKRIFKERPVWNVAINWYNAMENFANLKDGFVIINSR